MDTPRTLESYTDSTIGIHKGFQYAIVRNADTGMHTAYIYSMEFENSEAIQKPQKRFSKFALSGITYKMVNLGSYDIPTVSMKDKNMLDHIVKLTLKNYMDFVSGME